MTAALELSVLERDAQRRLRDAPRTWRSAPQTGHGPQIVVSDADAAAREICAEILRRDGYAVTTCGSAQEALDYCAATSVAVLVMSDGQVPSTQVRGVRAHFTGDATPLVILLAEHPTASDGIAATRGGAFAYLPKPFAACHLQVLVGRAVHSLGLDAETRGAADDRPLSPQDPRIPIGTSPALRRALSLARKVAATSASVFITGESGSGKEMIAHLIHSQSRRSRNAFVPVNCAALPDGLLETEMFGHRKGAFTGAVRDKAGLLETAHGGTLFLDELLELPPALQAKLLRVTQDGVVRRVGSETTDAVVDVRLIAATNGDPEVALRTQGLRADLYYRLCVVPIRVPPLRERVEDIPLLANHFLATSWRRHRGSDGPPPQLSDPALRLLLTHPWPGNVRELQNLIEHVSVIAKPGAKIGASDVPLARALRLVKPPRPAPPPPDRTGGAEADASEIPSYHTLRDGVLMEFERRYLAALLRRAHGSMTVAARLAAVPRSTLYRMMQRHGHAPSGGERSDRTTHHPRTGEGTPEGVRPEPDRSPEPVTDKRPSGRERDSSLTLCEPVRL